MSWNDDSVERERATHHHALELAGRRKRDEAIAQATAEALHTGYSLDHYPLPLDVVDAIIEEVDRASR